jgi:ATP-binding cassette subfamily B protein
MKMVIDELTEGESFDMSKTDQIVMYLICMGGVLLLNAATSNIAQYISELQQQKVADYMAGLIQKKSLEVDMKLYDDPDFHNSYFLAQRHGLHRPSQLVAGLMDFLQNAFSLLFLGGFVFYLHEFVALLLFVSVFPSAIIKYLMAEKLFHWEKKRTSMEREAVYLNMMVTDAAYAKEVRIFDAGLSLSKRFQALKSTLFGEKKGLNGLRVKMNVGAQAVEIVAEIWSYIFVVYRTINGLISIGELVIFFQAFQKGKANLSASLQAMVKLAEHRLFLSHFLRFIKLKPTMKDQADRLALNGPITSGITLSQVSFKYPKTESYAVEDISLNIPMGQITALVGDNGSGKSTLVKLIARLYDPLEGSLSLDGTNYKAIRLSDLRAKMSITFQDFAKYFLTIGENIRFSDLDNKERETLAAEYAQMTGADLFINELPNGYQQRLGRMFSESTELSVGQWQKIALARMLYKEAEVLIVDEPTSAIDPIAEHKIFEKLKEMAPNKIILLVTHRLYNLKMADQIVVMSKGKVIEQGSHDDLIIRNGQYAKMLSKQL